MTSNLAFLSLFARRLPEMYDAIHPQGPGRRVMVDPSVLSRGAEVALNPQPLPPGPVEAGMRFASSLLELDGFAGKLGQKVTPIGDWDGPIDDLGAPNAVLAALIDWLIRHGRPVPDPQPDWYTDAAVGIVLGLARSAAVVERSEFLGDVFQQASAGLEQG